MLVARPRKPRAAVPLAESAAREALIRAANNYELAERRIVDEARFSESISDLESRLIDPGWQRFSVLTAQEFTDEGRRQMRDVCRLMAVANPLIVRGLSLRSAYIHGAGYDITARANGQKDDEQDVQAVIAKFLTNRGNRRAFTGAAARDRLEKTLGTDGEYFVALFTRPTTGDVSARVVLTDEITKIIHNPEDRSDPWFYRREWDEVRTNPDGSEVIQRQVRLYPDVNHKPSRRARRFAGQPIAWDAPIVHMAVNRPEHAQHGIPDVYAAIAWARAYKTYLEQWAALMSALSRFAWKASSKTPAQAAALKARTSRVPLDPQTGEGAVGGFASLPDGTSLEPISKSGATIDSESGRPLAMMVAAALDVPVTMLLGDPGLTGSRATAETLDTPTELAMGQRREVWSDADQQIIDHVIAAAVKAPKGPLKGKVEVDRWDDTETVDLGDDTDLTVDYDWPDLDQQSTKDAVAAIVQAHGTEVIPPETTLRLLLAALGVKDPESIVAAVMEAQEKERAAAAVPGQVAAVPAGAADNTAGLGADSNGPDVAAQGTQPAATGADMAAAVTGDQLVALAIEHATSGDWAKLDDDAAALTAAEESDAAPAATLPAHWADEKAVDDDWRTDAALARGAEVAEAYGSQDPDDNGLKRGYDIASADAQLLGGQAPTFDEFAAAAREAKSYTPTVQLDNRIVATALRVGRYAAIVGQPLSACPYQGGDGEQAALRRVWLTAYLRIRPATAEGASTDEPEVAEEPPTDEAGN